MMVNNGNGTFTAGPLDVLLILHDVGNDTYHPAFFEEAPMPGPVPDYWEVSVVRLKSKMHHTEGAKTLEEAQKLFDELAEKIELPEENRWRDKARDWDGQLGIVFVEQNWRRRAS